MTKQVSTIVLPWNLRVFVLGKTQLFVRAGVFCLFGWLVCFVVFGFFLHGFISSYTSRRMLSTFWNKMWKRLLRVNIFKKKFSVMLEQVFYKWSRMIIPSIKENLMEFLGHTDHLPFTVLSYLLFWVSVSVPGNIFTPFLRYSSYGISRSKSGGLEGQERPRYWYYGRTRQGDLISLGTLAVSRDILEISLKVIVHEMLTGQYTFYLPQY